MWQWQTMLASAVGSAVPLVGIYVFFFKQVIEAKNAKLEFLETQVEHLTKQRSAEIIQENRSLIEEVQARVKEKQEIEERAARQEKELRQKIDTAAEELKAINAKLVDSHKEVIPREVWKRDVSANTQAGLLAGRISLIKARQWLRGLAGEHMDDPILRSLEYYIEKESDNLSTLQEKVSNDAFLTPQDLNLSDGEFARIRTEGEEVRKVLLGKKQEASSA